MNTMAVPPEPKSNFNFELSSAYTPEISKLPSNRKYKKWVVLYKDGVRL